MYDILAKILCLVTILIYTINLTTYIHHDYIRKAEYTKKLKLTYEYIQNVCRRFMCENNIEKLSQSKMFSDIKTSCSYLTKNKNKNCQNFYEKIINYLPNSKLIKLQNYKTYYLSEENIFDKEELHEDYNNYAIALENDVYLINYVFFATEYTDSVFTKMSGKYLNTYIARFDIDINGKGEPNIYGRDIYRFYIKDNGILIPFQSIDYDTFCSKNTYKNQDVTMDLRLSGTTCAAKIMANNWKMKY